MKGSKRKYFIEILVFSFLFLIVFFSVTEMIVVTQKKATVIGGLGTTRHKRTAVEKTQLSRGQLIIRAQNRKKAWLEFRRLEKSLGSLMRQSVYTPEEAKDNFQFRLFVKRITKIIQKAESDAIERGDSVYNAHIHFNSSFVNSPLNVSLNQKYTNPSNVKPEIQKFNENHNVPSFNASVFNARQKQAVNLKNIVPVLSRTPPKPNVVDSNSLIDSKVKLYTDEENKKQEEDNKYNMLLKVNETKLLEESSHKRLKLCEAIPHTLVGNVNVDLNRTIRAIDVQDRNLDLMLGGEWKPTDCVARYRVAFIIPFRDRWEHLKVLLYYLLPILKRQQLHFRIFVVEQYGSETFNKGNIMNAAFLEAMKMFDFHCVTFHDVDLIPEDDRNMYTCTEMPKHMSISIDKFSYTLPYQGLVGGVLSFRAGQFQKVNGYSNMYWGWGAEDDDMTTRILVRGLRIYRPPNNIARYKMIRHGGRPKSEWGVRMKLLRFAGMRSRVEGLNNVNYRIVFIHQEKLFTHIMVDIGKP